MRTDLIIAVDGPAGAGKSSVSMRLAQRLNYRYIDTGALYRIVGLLAHEQQVKPTDGPGLARLCENLRLSLEPGPGGMRVRVDGRDVTTAIRRPEVSQLASRVSAQPSVRHRLLAVQRELGAAGGVVMEGRDIGTVVFPHADLKFYLHASAAERGRRRFLELQRQGHHGSLEVILKEMRQRDRRDSTRDHAPLQRAVDAVSVDTTSLTLDEVVDRLAAFVHDHASVDRSKENR